MNRFIPATIWFVTTVALLVPNADSGAAREPKQLGTLLAINDTLSVLREYADDVSSLRLKLQQLDYINEQRKHFGAKPLQYDLTAGRVITAHLAEMTRERTFAHRNLAGEFAYHRWAKTGHTEHVHENLYALFTSGRYSRDAEDILQRMATGVDAFLAEQPPQDGHRRALLDQYATHVGIGFRQSPDDQSFRYGELYVHKYLELTAPPAVLTPRDTLRLQATLLRKDVAPYAFFGYWMPPLHAARFEELFTDKPYPDGSPEVPIERWPWDFDSYQPGKRSFTLIIPLRDVKPGVLYGVLHISDRIDDIPYRGGHANSEGTIPAGAVVVEIRP